MSLLSSIRPHCRISIAIPAKNEAGTIANALGAFVHQASLDGAPLDPELFEVLVLANDCSDETAGVVRAFATANPRFAVHVLSCELPKDAAHVGSARRIALDVACQRQESVHGDTGIIASTDADSCVDRFWIARTLSEMTNVDAVAGHVEIASVECDTMSEPLRRLYDRERHYRQLLGEVEASYDPRPYDPPRRHNSFVGTSFAVRTRTYVDAGRLPILRQLEDVAFARALRRVDARIRHAYDVRAETSARAVTRVVGGFGTYIDYLRDRGSRGETYLVDSGLRSVLRAKTRGLLRAYWSLRTTARHLDEVAELYQLAPRELASLVDPSSPFGETLDRIEATSIPFEALPEEPVDEAIAVLRDAVSAAMPFAATRMSAASGAG